MRERERVGGRDMTGDELLEVDDAHSRAVQRARVRSRANGTAGPGWFYMPAGPDPRRDPKLRADLKMLSQRNTWDPKRRCVCV